MTVAPQRRSLRFLHILGNQTVSGRLTARIISTCANIMSRFEGKVFGDEAPLQPPIFIIGFPRSGTTLVYQTMCHSFKLAYTPMLTNYLIWMPSFAVWLCKHRQLKYSSDFESSYGVSKGMASPGEGAMWNLWFVKDKYYCSLEEVENKNAAEIKKFIGRTERILQAPFINKNLRNNNRIGPLAELFPRALFVVVLRHPQDVALSLLQARINLYGDINRIFSVKPRLFPKTETLAEKSVVEQLNGLMKDVLSEMNRIGNSRFWVVRYEDFCESPPASMQRFAEFSSQKGVVLKKHRPPPLSFGKQCVSTDKSINKRIKTLEEVVQESFDWHRYNKLISL